jgi:hypothetical protein
MPKKKKAPRSGSTISEDERARRGQQKLFLRLSPELAARIDTECERRGLLRPALVRTALEEWLASAK